MGIKSATAAIGIVAEEEFADARAAIGELMGSSDDEDWLDARWGLCIGLPIAGVDAKTVVADLASFLGQRDRTGKPAEERALDAFASHTARPSPRSQVRPTLSLSRSWSFPASGHSPAADGMHGFRACFQAALANRA